MPKQRSKPSISPLDSGEEVARRIGRRLQEARLARGEDMHDIADFLRVQPAYLGALEAGDLAAMPARPYVLGFLRTYGTYLGFDAQALVDELKHALSGVAPVAIVQHRQPITEGRRATATMLTASLLLASAVYGGYYVVYRSNGQVPDQVAEAPGEVAKLAADVLRRAEEAAAKASMAQPAPPTPLFAPPLPGSATPPAAAPRAPAATAVASAVPAPTSAAALQLSARDPADVPAPAVHAEAVASTPTAANAAPGSASELLAAIENDRANAQRQLAAAPTVTVPPPAADVARVALLATESSWIQIKSSDSQFVRTRTLEAGERFELPNRTDLALWTGNAGGLELMLDGQNVGSVGRRGEVLKNIPLAPDRLKARPAPAARP